MKTQIQPQPEYNQKGLAIVLYEKLCFYLEIKEVKEILSDLYLLFGVSFTIYLIFFIDNEKDFLLSIVSWKNYAVFRAMLILLIILSIKPLLKTFALLYARFRMNSETLQKKSEPCKKNIDLPEFIYRTKSFKLTDAKKYGITQSQYPRIRDELFAAGILERGENNSIVLANGTSLFQLRNIFDRIDSPSPTTEIKFLSNSIKTA